MIDRVSVRRALISVSDKTDLVPFARRLAARGVEILSTGGTAAALSKAGLAVTPVEEVTGFPEMMDGRLKTLHPRIHGGLLALRNNPEHLKAMQEHGIEPIDLLCVNLYPFEKTVATPGAAENEIIEQIDIGGPAMVRSAAKNMAFVAVVTAPSQYDRVCNDFETHEGATSLDLRRWLGAAAFARTAAYDAAIANWMLGHGATAPEHPPGEPFPQTLALRYALQQELRYGENPHQAGSVYIDPGCTETSVVTARQLHGKALSFCNLYDADGALELVKEIDPAHHAAAAVIKHANPCGFAIADELATAFERAYQGDPLAAFGGIVALNRPVDGATAEKITGIQSFFDVILAPGYDEAALEQLRGRWKNTRLLQVGPLEGPAGRRARLDFKFLTGGLLAHDRDIAPFDPRQWNHAAGPEPARADLDEMALAMIAAKHLKSNAVSLVNDRMLIGAGAGQMDRVASCRLAIEKAGERARGAIAGSDAFFPFRDGPDMLINAGIRAIVQPGGSMRDQETIDACNEKGITLVLTGQRHFRH